MTTNIVGTNSVQDQARAAFLTAVKDLHATHAQFQAAELSSLAHSRARESALATALMNLAAMHGVVLEAPLQIDSNGEFSLVCERSGPVRAPFGTFATVLNGHRPRCGVQAGATLLPESRWCRMNHFDVERLVVEQNALVPQ